MEIPAQTSVSIDNLRDAYSRMDMERHPWSRHATSEVSVLEGLVGGFSGKDILDAGCGHGRHSVCIARSFPDAVVTGIDFSESNITVACGSASGLGNVRFVVADLRDYSPGGEFDIVLCLYDVVGSFPDDADNMEIIRSLATSCKVGGYLALSVMNLEYTVSHALPGNIGNPDRHPEMLSRLPSSETMQASGNIFDPRFYLVDPESGIVFRKEQFSGGSSLPAEYVIRDRRYTRSQIESLLREAGFGILESRYVRAGKWDDCLAPTDDGAKEVLVIARRLPDGV